MIDNIQDALTSKTEVKIPAGVYLLDKPLVAGPRLKSIDAYGVKLRPSESFEGESLLKIHGEDLKTKRISEITVRGMNLDGDHRTGGMSVMNTDHCTLRDVVTFRCSTGVYTIDNWDLLLDNVFGIVCGTGLVCSASDKKEPTNVLRVFASTFERCSDYGIYIKNSNNVWITDCKVHGIPKSQVLTNLGVLYNCSAVRISNMLQSQTIYGQYLNIDDSCKDVLETGTIRRVLK